MTINEVKAVELSHKASEQVQKAIKLVLMPKDQIKAGQDKIRKTIVSLDMEVHANAVQCLMHAEKHGDTSLMTRLLMEILDDKTGYRRQGLIAWMRSFSPMELSGKTINLTGMIDGKKRPFLIEKANETPFYAARQFAERPVKPIWQDTLLSKWDSMVKEFEACMENTVDGKPVDPKKPFYDGLHSAQILDFINKGKEMRLSIPQDATREVRQTQARIAQDQEFVKANEVQAA